MFITQIAYIHCVSKSKPLDLC